MPISNQLSTEADPGRRIDHGLEVSVARASAAGAPPKLAAALQHAVFPGGARVRPRLCLAVALACGDDAPALSNGAAVAIELLHCASLVHDDLPCFDDADLRRGKPSVHKQFNEPLAVLAGDALIVAAFEAVALGGRLHPARIPPVTLTIAQAVGMPLGIVAGQGWESEEDIDLVTYHREKTGALFVGACVAGALAAGADPAPWRTLGQELGEAYQVADDLRDAAADIEEIGKPIGVDAAHGRPSAVTVHGLEGALDLLRQRVNGAVAAIPDCPGADQLRGLIRAEAKRLVPKKLAQHAA